MNQSGFRKLNPIKIESGAEDRTMFRFSINRGL